MELGLLERLPAWNTSRISTPMMLTVCTKGMLPLLTLAHLLMRQLILEPGILLGKRCQSLETLTHVLVYLTLIVPNTADGHD